jgi:purine-nucleoside phosphorylase
MMRTVFYTEKWKDTVRNFGCQAILTDGMDLQFLKNKIRQLAQEGVKELLIFGDCVPFDPGIKEAVFIITDHINATGENPLTGINDDSVGPRFPDMTFAYSEKLTAELKNFLTSSGMPFTETILYGAENPPSDPAELSRLKSLNAAACDKTTVFLDIIARHAGIEVAAAVKTIDKTIK